MGGNAKGLGGGPGGHVIQMVSAGPFARPPVTRSEAVATHPGACASEGGLSGPALILFAHLLAVLGLVCGLGCSSGVQKIVRPPPQRLELTTAFVYPFEFKWEEPLYRRFELSQRLINEAVGYSG